jgi:pyruvate dehydrogenase E1 component alpha subunit
LLNQTEIDAIRLLVEGEMEAAIAFAKDSPSPSIGDLTRDVYTVL